MVMNNAYIIEEKSCLYTLLYAVGLLTSQYNLSIILLKNVILSCYLR